MLELVIGNRSYSSWSLRAWLVLRRSGLEAAVRRLAFGSAEFARAAGAELPAAKVPVLHHDGHTVWESLAIAEYLAELAPEARLWPADLALRAEARAAACEMHASFAALRAELPMNCRANHRRVAASPAAARDIARICALWGALRERHAAGGPWLLGRWSIADAMYAPVASRFATYGVAIAGEPGRYLRTALADPHLREWRAAARAEPEVVVEEEVGETG